MVSALSSLVDNLVEGTHKIICKGSGCCFEFESIDDNLTNGEILSCNKNYSKNLMSRKGV